MTKTRISGWTALALGTFFMTLPAPASADERSVTLTAERPYRGYEVWIRAVKAEESPVRISVSLRDGVQVHQYSFEAPRRALRFGADLASGRLRLAALSDEAGGYGGGTIKFAAIGPVETDRCAQGTTRTRAQMRTAGGMRFSPTQSEAAAFVRTRWTGRAEETRNGGCAPPVTCDPATRISAYRTDEVENYAVLAWRFESREAIKVQGSYWLVDPDGPASFVRHTRTVRTDRSRFSATGFSQAALDLDGLDGFAGSFTVEAAGEPVHGYGVCEAEMIEGTASGDAATAFAFAPDQSGGTWSGGMIYEDK